MSQLTWWPYSPADWEKKCVGLSFEERGALQHVINQSWLYRDPVGTIANTTAEFQMLLGPRWKKLIAMIKQQFTEDVSTPGLLRCEWLAQLHATQSVKYQKRVEAGVRGLNKQYGDRHVARNKGQENLFPRRKKKEPVNNPVPRVGVILAMQDAMHGALPLSMPGALLAQKLDSSLEPRTGAAVAVASNAPAAPKIDAPAWTGPGFDELRAWAEASPEISSAVSDRVAGLVRHIPAGVQVPTTRRLYETQALQDEYALRHAEQNAGASAS